MSTLTLQVFYWAHLAMWASGLSGCQSTHFEGPVRSVLETRQAQVVMQKYDLSCGAAALATLLNHQLGERLTEREVAVGLMRRADYIQTPSLVVQRTGFSLLDLKRYVNTLGYVGEGLGQLSLNELDQYAPLIVPVNLSGYNHFVIFKAQARGQVWFIDPAWGHRHLPAPEFERAWLKTPELGKVGFKVSAGSAS
jgi:uncharacterized protein